MVDADLLERTVRTLLRDQAALAPDDLDAEPAALMRRRAPGRQPAALLVAAAVVVAAVIGLAYAVAPAHGHGHSARGDRSTAGGAASPGGHEVTTIEIGSVVRTHIPYDGGQLGLGIARDASRQHLLSLMIATLRTGDITFTRTGVLTDPASPSTAPGFHGSYDAAGYGTDHHTYLLVGFYVGSTPRVTATVDGVQHRVHVAQSSVTGVWVWWLAGPTITGHPSKAGPHPALTSLVAADPDTGQVISIDTRGAAHG